MPVCDLHTDQELLIKISEKDQYAFRIVYDKYCPHLYNYVLKLLKSKQLAEEVIQEIFLRFWKLGDDLITIQNIESYLVILARNKSHDMLRRNKLRDFAALEQAEMQADQDYSTERLVALNDVRRTIGLAINKLPAQQRLVYQLCQIEGFKYEEAAQKLNLSTDTVRSYMKLALRNLRQQLTKHPDLVVFLLISKMF